ncbi:MAG: hypothetical protein GC200_12310 [Tepidisphaera sp.]|nr:hypothetical protein [Tepidisphaera sp.]
MSLFHGYDSTSARLGTAPRQPWERTLGVTPVAYHPPSRTMAPNAAQRERRRLRSCLARVYRRPHSGQVQGPG